MKKKLLLLLIALYPLYGFSAFNYETITTNFAVAGLDYDYKNFSWDISGYSDVKFDIDFDQTFAAIGLRFAYPRSGTVYLDVTNGITASTNLTFTLSRTNLPPKGPYYVEFIGYETNISNSPTRIIAMGKANIHYSVYQNTDQSNWTNPLAGTVIGPPVHTLSTPLSGWPFTQTTDFTNHTNNASAHHVKFANSDETDQVFVAWTNSPILYKLLDMTGNIISNADLSLFAGSNITWSSSQFHASARYTDSDATNAVLVAWPNLDTDKTDDVTTNIFTPHTNNISAHHVKFVNSDETDPTLTNRTDDIVPSVSNTYSVGTALKPFNESHSKTGYVYRLRLDNALIKGVVTNAYVTTNTFTLHTNNPSAHHAKYTDSDATNAVLTAWSNLATNSQVIFTNSISFSLTNTTAWSSHDMITAFRSIDIISGRLYVGTTNHSPYNQTMTMAWATSGQNPGARGGDFRYIADVTLSQVLLSSNIAVSATTLYVSDSSVFATNDLIWVQGVTNEWQTITSIVPAQNKLGINNSFKSAHLASNAVSRVVQYSLPIWTKNSAFKQYLWIKPNSTQTVDLVNWIEYKE